MREKAGNTIATAPDARTRSQNGSGRAQLILDEVNVGLLRALLDDPRLAIAELARREIGESGALQIADGHWIHSQNGHVGKLLRR